VTGVKKHEESEEEKQQHEDKVFLLPGWVSEAEA
jgi:hypothetical protein